MANDLAGNPLICDATGAITTGPTTLRALAWVSVDGNPIVADNDFELTDTAGRTLSIKRATVNGDGIEMYHFPKEFRREGLTIATIDAGVALIYI